MQLALTHGEQRAITEHRQITAAIRRRNAKHAAAALRQHILGAGQALLAFLNAQHRDANGHAATPSRRRPKPS
ncbi:MAG: FCD domain-containing protein [Gemmatimonadaceae bacterium]